MTSSNGNIFRVTGPLCGEFTGPGELPTQRPVTRSFDVFFDLCLNNRLSKQPWGWWFETPAWSLWRHRNDYFQGTCSIRCSPWSHYLSQLWFIGNWIIVNHSQWNLNQNTIIFIQKCTWIYRLKIFNHFARDSMRLQRRSLRTTFYVHAAETVDWY